VASQVRLGYERPWRTVQRHLHLPEVLRLRFWRTRLRSDWRAPGRWWTCAPGTTRPATSHWSLINLVWRGVCALDLTHRHALTV